jgi:hypothetical protein
MQELDEKDPNYTLHKISYWVLEYSNTVLVKRDRAFFEGIVPHIKTFWKDVEYFREHRDELDVYIKSSKPKNDYYAIDLLVNAKTSDSDTEKTESDRSNKCLMLDSDSEENFTIIKIPEKKKKITKSPKISTKEHFKGNNKKQNIKYKNISGFSGCMLD